MPKSKVKRIRELCAHLDETAAEFQAESIELHRTGREIDGKYWWGKMRGVLLCKRMLEERFLNED